MSYFVLTNPVGPGNKLADFRPGSLTINFLMGCALKEAPPNPIELIWDPENEGGLRASYYSAAPAPLMTKELVDALHSAGVDNLDIYPVVIHSQTGKPDCHDYVAVNVIGIVAAADMDQSEYDDDEFFDGLFDVSFDSIVIDEAKAEGHLLFRMAEAVSTVIVHESVAGVLQAKGGFGLTLVKPEDHVT